MLPRTRSASSFLLFALACACGTSAENKNANPTDKDASTGGSAGSSGSGGSAGGTGGSGGSAGTTTDAGDASAGAAGAAGSPADAGCGDTISNPDNCGSCGHSCLGGTCEDSLCQPVTIATLTKEEPTYITASGSDIYFDSSEGVRRVAKDGVSNPVTLSGPSGNLRGLERGSNWVYSANAGGGVQRTPVLGGGIEVLWAGGGAPETVTVLNPYVYWADPTAGEIRRVPQTGGTLETVSTAFAQSAYALASQGQVLYWVRLNGVIAKLDTSLAASASKLADLAKPAPPPTWQSRCRPRARTGASAGRRTSRRKRPACS